MVWGKWYGRATTSVYGEVNNHLMPAFCSDVSLEGNLKLNLILKFPLLAPVPTGERRVSGNSGSTSGLGERRASRAAIGNGNSGSTRPPTARSGMVRKTGDGGLGKGDRDDAMADDLFWSAIGPRGRRDRGHRLRDDGIVKRRGGAALSRRRRCPAVSERVCVRACVRGVVVERVGVERRIKMSGPECCSNPPTLNPNGGEGHVEKVGGLDTYLTGSPHSNLAILLVSDVFGYEAPNLRKLADKIAAAGYYVAVPDFFHGEPFNPENHNRPLLAWIKDHGQDKGFEDAKPIVEALKSKGVSAIGAAGFCWGAKVVVELGKSRLIQSAVLLHPSFVTVDDIKGVDVPIAILGAEVDQISPPELIKQFEEVLAAKSGVECFVKVFPKTSHGWTVRYDTEDAEAVKAAEEAHQVSLDWFAKYLK